VIFVAAVFALMVVAPVIAVAKVMRDHQLVAPAVGSVEITSAFRRDRVLRSAPARWPTIAPLLWLEARRLVMHPAPYVITAPLFAVWLMTVTDSWVIVHSSDDISTVTGTVPLAWGTLIASNLLTLRSRRWRSEELLATTPVPERSRTVAHLLASLVMVPASVALLCIWFAAGAWSGRTVGTPRAAVLAVVPLIVVGAGCVGVAVARWLPKPVFGWVAVVATLILQLNFGHTDSRWRWLHFSSYGSESVSYPWLAPEFHEIHLVYLIGGILLVAAVALARDGIDARNGALLGTAVALMLVAGVLQVRPLSDEQVSMYAERVENPAWNQRCEERERVTFCFGPGFADFVPYWHGPVDGVLARVPADALDVPLVVRQRPLMDATIELPAPIVAAIDPTKAWPDDDEVAVSYGWELPSSWASNEPGAFELALGFRVASLALGLPPDAWWPAGSDEAGDRPGGATGEGPSAAGAAGGVVPIEVIMQCLAPDQARSVAAVWLAGQSTPLARGALLRRAGEVIGRGEQDVPVSFDSHGTYNALLPDPLPEQGTVVRGSHIVWAAALLARDDTHVAEIWRAHWDELAGRTGTPAGTADVLSWFDTDEGAIREVVAATAPSFNVAIDGGHEEDNGPAGPPITTPCASVRR